MCRNCYLNPKGQTGFNLLFKQYILLLETLGDYYFNGIDRKVILQTIVYLVVQYVI